MKATLCDICRKQIPSDTGGRATATKHGAGAAHTEVDLCDDHFLQYKTAFSQWIGDAKKKAAGYMT